MSLVVERDGRYYIRDTRVMARDVADVLATGMSVDELADDWGLTEEDVRAARRVYERHEDEIESQREAELDEMKEFVGDTDE